jgi:hypothetical protein
MLRLVETESCPTGKRDLSDRTPSSFLNLGTSHALLLQCGHLTLEIVTHEIELVAGGPFTVYTGNLTTFVNINGLSGLQAAGAVNLVSRGLVFYDPNTSKPIVWAGLVNVLP